MTSPQHKQEAKKSRNWFEVTPRRWAVLALGSVALALGGGASMALLGKRGGEKTSAPRVAPHKSLYTPKEWRLYQQEAPKFLGRSPVEINKDPSEIPADHGTITLWFKDFPSPVRHLTPALIKSGYQEVDRGNAVWFQPPRELPPEAKKEVLEEVNLINSILTPDNQIKRINLYPLEDPLTPQVDLNGYPAPNGIDIYIRPGHKVKNEEIRRMAFHEAMHVFQNQADISAIYGDNNRLHEDWDKSWKLMDRIMQQQGESQQARERLLDTVIAGQPPNVEALHALFSLVDEKSYFGHGGHPYTDWDELFADSLTTMHFYPKSFMHSDELLPPKSRQLIKKTGADSLGVLYKFGASKQGVDNLFSPQLRRFLGFRTSGLGGRGK